MSKFRSWLFTGSVVAAAGAMVTTWLMPWWGVVINQLGAGDRVRIYPYGLWNDLGGDVAIIRGSEMPGFFAPLMWLYLGLCVVGLLFALWKKEKIIRLMGRHFNISRLLIGIVGFSFVIMVIIFWFYAKSEVEYYDIDFLGKSWVEFGIVEKSFVFASLRTGFYMACAVGPFLILLALLRNKIIGRARVVPLSDTNA